MKKLGYLGMGIMGSAMARNLLDAGYELTVWNRSPEKCAALVDSGATLAATAAEVAATCDITFACVSDPEAAIDLCLGPDGVLEGIGENRGYVDMSTIDVETSQIQEEAILGAGGRYLEAPVSGSKKPAVEGNLIILAAGERTLYDEALPAFDVMGKMSLHLGDVGAGAAMKLVVNMVMGTMMAAFTEGMTLAEKAGLSPQDLLEVLDNGAVSNPMFRVKGPLMQSENFAPAFPLKHAQKDIRLALLLGDLLSHSMPTSSAANEVFKRARAMGFGDSDFSAVFKASQ